MAVWRLIIARTGDKRTEQALRLAQLHIATRGLLLCVQSIMSIAHETHRAEAARLLQEWVPGLDN